MNENNISKYERIQKEILIIARTFILKHVVLLNSKMLKEDENKKISHYFEYGTKAEYFPYPIVRNVNLRDRVQWLVLEYKPLDKNEKGIRCRLFYKDFPGILELLNKIKTLFENTNDLYKISEDNKIIDINDKYLKHLEILFFKGNMNRFISLRPNVLVDRLNVYPSVLIESDEGIIGNITYDEFLTLKLALEEYIRNFHTLSNQLVNTLYLHCIGYPTDAEEVHELK